MIGSGIERCIALSRKFFRFLQIVLLKYSLNRSSTHPNFNPIKVRTHDLHVIDSKFHIPQMMLS